MGHLAMVRGARFAALSCVLLASVTARAQPTPPPLPSDTPPPPPTTPTPTPTAPPPVVEAPPVPGPAATAQPGQAGQPPEVLPPAGPGAPPCAPCGRGDREHGDREHGGRPYLGGFGYGSIGMMSGEFAAMQKTLEQPSTLGIGYGPAPTGFVFGGGGGGLIHRLWVGGKGFGLAVAMASSDRATTTLSGGGGGFELGYAVIASEQWLVVPFFGLGGFGYTLTVKNNRATDLPLYQGEAVPGGGQREYSAGFATGELGIRASRLLFFGTGGFMVGAELGYMTSLQRAAWEETSSKAPAPESAELRAAYFRLIVGGGGFEFRGGSSGKAK